MAAATVAPPSEMEMLPRPPQVGIGRLTTQRRPSGDSKQAMNCKSCRKRKIKCNRLKPSCEACQVFSCPCIYDAVPKKRGPKTDVLEALVKRVNGLEKRLKDEGKPDSEGDSPEDDGEARAEGDEHADGVVFERAESIQRTAPPQRIQPVARQSPPVMAPMLPNLHTIQYAAPSAVTTGSTLTKSSRDNETIAFTDALLDTYFARIHSKPYYILDEANTRQRLREGQLPQFMINAIHAVSIRYVPHLCGGYSGAVRTGQDYAARARAGIDVDEPSIDNLQALLLLAMAQFQAGKGKKSYMLVSHATSMAFALDLHREVPGHLRVAAVEREGRRKLFWTCYLMDRFTTSGSKRPALISDESISLRFPASGTSSSQRSTEASYFPNGSSLNQGNTHASNANGSAAVLVEIVRILGAANRYLASGGVKGDPHFPWHAQSTLSKIRSDLDKWAASTQEAFASLENLFGRQDSVSLVLSKLIYHLVHCLLYRPFLPVDLAELSGNSQNQSWQIEATNLCFMHANAIVELVDIGKATGILYWPSFVGYCVCTAGTIHIHGAHYVSLNDNDVFANSSDFLSREMAQLADQSFIWAGVNHQRETMQTVYANHSHLVHSLSCSPIRFSPVFQMEDFFDRYPGANIDGAHMTFSEVQVDTPPDRHHDFRPSAQSSIPWSRPAASLPHLTLQPQSVAQNTLPDHPPPAKRRRVTEGGGGEYPYPTPTNETQPNPFEQPHYHFPPNPIPSQPTLEPNNTDHFSSSPSQQDTIYNIHDLPHPITAAALDDQNIFSPSFTWGPAALDQNTATPSGNGMYPPSGMANEMQTPGGESAGARSSHTVGEEGEGDPFLSFLEQLAANDGDGGGVSDLGFFMAGEGGEGGFGDESGGL
ncbi:uncharacterized protein LTR77_004215 [Saxophila tyrrhenica]|uniref:Zn(2)-C6 fungal-type domain-containing protein n=1 Tax=Saxophila tyrrhenica TaxID=1690608 RepID=A0AAV9PC57_9PEZI|nr:hypothetical protein LTR77_004215 [Saxophila tyrrhenica]